MSDTEPRPVYMDYAATTPVDSRVATAMSECLTFDGSFGNPASINHALGAAARARVERARAQVAALIGAEAAAMVWTSGATEADNLAILGVARFSYQFKGPFNRQSDRDGGRHIVTSRTEHKAVLDACKQLEKEGFGVTYLQPDKQGSVHPEQVAEALTPTTILVSIMHVNNELGVIQDIAAIGQLCRERGVLFHVDAAQSAGKIALDVKTQCIDLLSLSAHKLYGPKGIGALYVRRKPPIGLIPLLFGGGQEGGLRSGTLPTHQIVGMGLACEIAVAERESDARRLEPLQAQLWQGLQALGGVHLNGGTTVPHILNVSFEGVEGESLISGLRGLAVSSGAACSSAAPDASYVLRALGRSDALAQASLRFSLGRFSTAADVAAAIATIRAEVTRLRHLSPAAGLLAPAADVISGEAGSVEQGTWVRFYLRLSGRMDGRHVTEARFQVYGCPHTIAAAEWLAQRLPGRAIDALLPEGVNGVAAQLGTPTEKLGRLLVIEDALHACLRQPR
jgi:cysteine desulfurase